MNNAVRWQWRQRRQDDDDNDDDDDDVDDYEHYDDNDDAHDSEQSIYAFGYFTVTSHKGKKDGLWKSLRMDSL